MSWVKLQYAVSVMQFAVAGHSQPVLELHNAETHSNKVAEIIIIASADLYKQTGGYRTSMCLSLGAYCAQTGGGRGSQERLPSFAGLHGGYLH